MKSDYSINEIKELYKNLGLPQKTVELLKRYFSALANLYGIISLSEAFDIIESQNPGLVTFDKLYELSDIALHEKENFFYVVDMDEMWDGEPAEPETREIVADYLLLVDEEEYYDLRKMQAGKPIYIPAKRELLKYEDESYYEKNPQAIAVENFFKKRMNIQGDYFREVMTAVSLAIRTAYDPVSYVFELLMMHRIKMTKSESSKFIELFADMINNCRIPANRGYTPKELGRLMCRDNQPPEVILGDGIMSLLENGALPVNDFRQSVLSSDLPVTIKSDLLSQIPEINGAKPIAKNALCPCGSGKKYKRCCGEDNN